MNNNKVYGLLGLAMRAGKIVFGTDSCIEDIQRKKVKLVIVATDSAERTKMKLNKICSDNNVAMLEFSTIEELSNAIGKSNKAILGIRDINFSNEIKKIINGGEAIG